LSVVPDGSGWYQILNPAEDWEPDHLILNWLTHTMDDGLYEISLQFADGTKSIIHTTPPLLLVRTDNSKPQLTFKKLRWRVAGSGWNELPLTCPVIARPAGKDIELEVTFEASATHLRSVHVSGEGCGAPGGPPAPSPELVVGLADPTQEGPPGNLGPQPTYWHKQQFNNYFQNTGHPTIFALPGSAPQGAYTLSVQVISRAFNPAGGDGGLAADWNYNPVWRWIWDDLHVAVVDV
jgi:hypothetical protein